MREKIKHIKETINGKSNSVIYIILFILILSIKLNSIFIDIAVVIVFFIISVLLDDKKLLCVYLYMFFFESVSKVQILNGTVVRIMMVVIFARMAFRIFKEKTKIQKQDMMCLVFFSTYYILSVIIDSNNIVNFTIIYVNILIILLFKVVFAKFTNTEKSELIKEMFNTIIVATTLSILYGLITNNFLEEVRAGFNTNRLNGTKDPNFLGFYINLALALLIFKPREELKKKTNIISILILLVGLILTKSVTGIFINIISSIVILMLKYRKKIRGFISNNKKKIINISIILIFIFITVIWLVIANNESKVHINEFGLEVGDNRIAEIIIAIKTKDIDRLTSRKTMIWKQYIEDYINNTNIIERAFGRGIEPIILYNQYYQQEIVSHCTYIDFLNAYGFFGSIMIYIFIIRKIRCNEIFEYKSDLQELKIVRILILVYSIELCIYPDRLLLLLFLL